MIYKELGNETIPKKEKFIEMFRPKGRSRLYESILRCLYLLENQKRNQKCAEQQCGHLGSWIELARQQSA